MSTNQEKELLIEDLLSDLCYKYIDEYGYESERDINCGDCEIFADEFIDILCEKDSSIEVKKQSTCLFTKNSLLSQETLFDKDKLEKYFNFKINDTFVEKITDANPGFHVWVCIGDKYYDSECVEGVENPFYLPFFDRCFAYKSSLLNNYEYSFDQLREDCGCL